MSSRAAAGRLVLGVEPLLAGVEAGDPGLQGGEVALARARRGPAASSRARLQPADLVVGGGGAGLQGVDLAVQPGQALAPVGGGALEPGDPALLLGGGVLGGLAGRDGLLEGGARGCSTSAAISCSCSRTRSASASSCVGVAPGAASSDSRGAGGVADPLGGQRLGAAQPLAQTGEGEPGLLGRGQRRQVLAQGRLEGGLGLAGRRRSRPRPRPRRSTRIVSSAISCSSAVRAVTRSSAISRARASRTSAWTLGGPAGHLGLAAERLELAADLVEQVVEPGQVALGGVELAERLLLALAVLEDAGGLLDEAAPVLGGRVQDRVELALPDDHVHLAADAGVAEQLLDVEQAAASCR